MKATIFVSHYIWDETVNNIPDIPRDFFANFSPLVSLRQIRMKWPDPRSSGPLRDEKSCRGHPTNPRGNVTKSTLALQSPNIYDIFRRADNQKSQSMLQNPIRSARVAQAAIACIVPVSAPSPPGQGQDRL